MTQGIATCVVALAELLRGGPGSEAIGRGPSWRTPPLDHFAIFQTPSKVDCQAVTQEAADHRELAPVKQLVGTRSMLHTS